MPELRRDDRIAASASELGFLLIHWASRVLDWLFLAAILLGLLRLLGVGALALVQRCGRARRRSCRLRHRTSP